jgi:thiol-disulfide isomerase/thioredoxin
MTAQSFLFSFLLFLDIQIESIEQSGFYKMLAEKYPQISEGWQAAENMNPEVQELTKLTGLNFEDLIGFNLRIEGLEGMSKASEESRSPKLGSELEFIVSAKIKGNLHSKKLFSFMLEKLEEEKGLAVRKKVENTIKISDQFSKMSVPAELLGKENTSTDLLLAINQGEKFSEIKLGVPQKVNASMKGKEEKISLACLDSMAEDRQITFALRIDPAVWDRPEFNTNQQNPLFAGLANSVKGIREFGVAVSFRDLSLGVEICVNCKDTQSALGLWTVAQGGLGMAQLAMAQEGGQAPAILSRIKTQAADKNVFIRVDLLEEDLNELERMQILPQQDPSEGSNIKKPESDPLIDKKAPKLSTKLLDGSSFNITKHKGKVVVLDFWATWCGPCVRALPELVENISSFTSEEAILVAVNQGESKKIISQFLKKKKLEGLTVALDKNQTIGRDYNVQGIPKTVVVDPNGVIRHVHVGFTPGMGERLKQEIKALLKE